MISLYWPLVQGLGRARQTQQVHAHSPRGYTRGMWNLEWGSWNLGEAGEVGLNLRCGEGPSGDRGEVELLKQSGNAYGCMCDF